MPFDTPPPLAAAAGASPEAGLASLREVVRLRFAIRPEHVHVFDRVSGRSLLNDGL